MADDELKLVAFRKWDETLLQTGGTTREVTKVRFFLGTHGPFDRTYDRDVRDDVIQQAIRDARSSLQAVLNT